MSTQEIVDAIILTLDREENRTYRHRVREGDGFIVAYAVCVEDFRRSLFPDQALHVPSMVVDILKSLKGKTVVDVVVGVEKNTDVTSELYDPFGNIVRIKVVTEQP